MSHGNLTLALFVVSLVAGCTKKEETATEAGSSTSVVTMATVAPIASASPLEEDDPSIVTAEDLESKAVQAISPANLEEQLDLLEKEIGSAE